MLGNGDPQTSGVLLTIQRDSDSPGPKMSSQVLILNQMPWAKITRLKLIENDTALEDQTLHFRT